MSTAQSLNISPELSAFVLGKTQNVEDVEAYLRRLIEEDVNEKQAAWVKLKEYLEPAFHADMSAYREVTSEELFEELRKR
jgi:hypothetical protein